MIKPTELAIADVMKHSIHGLVSFQPACDDRADAIDVPVRDAKGRLFQVSLNECSWPEKSERDNYWREFPPESPVEAR